MKKTIISTMLLGVTFSGAIVFADNRDDVTIPQEPGYSAVYHVDEKNEGFADRFFKYAKPQANLERLKAQGNRLIKERLNSLDSNKTVVNANKSLTDAQKTALVGRLTAPVAGLTALQGSTASSTDATSTKALISSIYTNFRIYGIVIPEVRLEKRIYDLQNHTAVLTATFAKVQTKIDEAKTAGKDVTVWQKNLDDAKVLVAKDTTTLTTLLAQVTALTPASYGTSSKAIIESANKSLKAINQDFNTIKKNLHKPAMLSAVKKGEERKKIVGSGTVTPSPLFGTSWAWVSATDNGTTTTPKNDKFVLTFGEDMRVSSKTDCNNLMGTYKLDGSSFSFGPLAMTMMFCDGSQEGAYAALLAKVTGYSVNGNELKLTFATGSMTFAKKN